MIRYMSPSRFEDWPVNIMTSTDWAWLGPEVVQRDELNPADWNISAKRLIRRTTHDCLSSIELERQFRAEQFVHACGWLQTHFQRHGSVRSPHVPTRRKTFCRLRDDQWSGLYPQQLKFTQQARFTESEHHYLPWLRITWLSNGTTTAFNFDTSSVFSDLLLCGMLRGEVPYVLTKLSALSRQNSSISSGRDKETRPRLLYPVCTVDQLVFQTTYFLYCKIDGYSYARANRY